jgi:hypothetical protein
MIVLLSRCCLLLLGILQWRIFTVSVLSVIVRRLAVAYLYCIRSLRISFNSEQPEGPRREEKAQNFPTINVSVIDRRLIDSPIFCCLL